jgi:hypothetical protein
MFKQTDIKRKAKTNMNQEVGLCGMHPGIAKFWNSWYAPALPLSIGQQDGVGCQRTVYKRSSRSCAHGRRKPNPPITKYQDMSNKQFTRVCDHMAIIFFRVWTCCLTLFLSLAQRGRQSSGSRWSVYLDSMNTLVDACNGHSNSRCYL